MTKRSKILVSVAGIFLVLLILVGLTYAYFLTRIQGNTNIKSISVTTADLKLVYDDGNGLITAENIIPGTAVTGDDGKTFTVTNEGNAAVNNYGIFLTGVENDLVDTSDMVYTLTCVSKSVSTNQVVGTCNGVSTETEFPTSNSLLVVNNIDVGIRHEYKLDVVFKETYDDQSDNMNKSINAKVDLYALAGTIDLEGTITGYQNGDYITVSSENPQKSMIKPTGTPGEGYYKVVGLLPDNHTITLYDSNGNVKASTTFVVSKGAAESVSGDTITMTDDTRSASIELTYNNSSLSKTISSTLNTFNPYKSGTLAYSIINNAIAGTNGTTYRSTPLTLPGQVPSLSGSTASTTLNDYSNETYFGQKWVAFTLNEYKNAENAIRRYRKYANPSSDDDAYASSTEIEKYLTNDCSSTVGKLIAMVPTSYNKPFVFPTYYVTGCSNGKPVVTDVESELSVSPDDYGNSYYFRGTVTDNFLNFGGKCWRIVRIEGDGSIKLVLQDDSNTCDAVGYNGVWASVGRGIYGRTSIISTNVNLSNEHSKKFGNLLDNEGIGGTITWLNSTSIDQSKLKNESWCYGDRSRMYYEEYKNSSSPFNYNYGDLIDIADDADRNSLFDDENLRTMYNRLWDLSSDFGVAHATFKCSENSYQVAKIGALSADEISFAGAKVWKGNDYYLHNSSNQTYWTTTLSGTQNGKERVLIVKSDGKITSDLLDNSNNYYRPSIVLNAGVTIAGGNGTQANPYTIN